MTYRLLSLDGGGIRGYMSSVILERLLREAGGQKMLDGVDGFAGTSTGGLIAIALVTGSPPSKLVDIYRNRADRIFLKNHFYGIKHKLARMAMEDLIKLFGHKGGPGILECQYLSDGLKELAVELVGNKTLGDVPKDKMLAVNTAYLMTYGNRGWGAATLTNQPLGTQALYDTPDISLVDAALATSAAPTYFPPHHIKTPKNDYGYFADGGTFANNPVMNGVEVAVSAGCTQLEDVQAISIGTGELPVGISDKEIGEPLDWGALAWFGITSDGPTGALLQLPLTASSDNQTRIAKNLLKERIVRLQPVLTEDIPLDGITPADFEKMDAAVNALTVPENEHWQRAIEMAKGWFAPVATS